MMQYLPYAIIVIVLTVIYVLMRSKYKKEVSAVLLHLVIQAEAVFGGGTGELKYSAVVSMIFDRLPASARIFLPYSLIESLIEDAVIAMKAYLEENAAAQLLVQKEV